MEIYRGIVYPETEETNPSKKKKKSNMCVCSESIVYYYYSIGGGGGLSLSRLRAGGGGPGARARARARARGGGGGHHHRPGRRWQSGSRAQRRREVVRRTPRYQGGGATAAKQQPSFPPSHGGPPGFLLASLPDRPGPHTALGKNERGGGAPGARAPHTLRDLARLRIALRGGACLPPQHTHCHTTRCRARHRLPGKAICSPVMRVSVVPVLPPDSCAPIMGDRSRNPGGGSHRYEA